MRTGSPKSPGRKAPRNRWTLARARLTLFAAALVAVGGAAATAAVVTYGQTMGEISRVRVGGGTDETRIVIELSQAASAAITSDDTAPGRVRISLPHTRSVGDLQGPSSGHLRQWKVQPERMGATVSIDFDGPMVVKRRFLLPPDDGIAVYRYVVDFAVAAPVPAIRATPARGQAAAAIRPARPTAPTVSPPQASAVLTAPQMPVSMRKVVVIDAGHGGRDPGTSGASTVEKDLTLSAARDLKAALQRTGRYQVVMTRDADVSVPLDQRMQIARREHADLFISLHVNSINDPSLHGASVYTLSEKGEDRVARQVFNRNGDWLTTADGASRDPSVNRILLDLTQRQTTNQSTGFANILLDRMSGRVDLVRRSHRDANFAVLLAPDVPAVLMEMGFITNPVDEQRLASPEQRRVMAESITDAIDFYFARPARLAVR